MSWRVDASNTGRFLEYRDRHSFGKLVQPRLGVVTSTFTHPAPLREPDIVSVTASMGDLSFIAPHIQSDGSRAGTGGDPDPELAWVRAVVEAAERYACLVYHPDDFVVDRADHLGAEALDLDGIPRCSARELARSHCPLRPADKTKPIRWVEGFSLVRHAPILVPAIMVHLSMVPWPAERFWLQISTGVAAHTDVHAAIVAAICECVERDAIALTWLGRLPLPRTTADLAATAPALARAVETSGIEFNGFDAATDLGIPTVFSVQVPRSRRDGPISVSCATAMRDEVALEKAVREGCPLRSILYERREIPADVMDFSEVIHGAAYYAAGHAADAFDFLLARDRPTVPPEPRRTPQRTDEAEGSRHGLHALLDLFGEREMDVIAVDLTTDELRDAGLWVVRVIIPELVPMSVVHRARYLATPRLRWYLERKWGRPFAEAEVNPDPMPFA